MGMETKRLLEKFHQLQSLIIDGEERPTDQHILYIDEKLIYYFKDGVIHGESSTKEYYGIRTLKAERGQILELFSKFEFLVNEVIKVHFFGLGNQSDFDQLLSYVDLSNQIKILKQIGLINRSMQDKITALISVRNQFAHVWKTNEVKFIKVAITEQENFKKFKEHLEKVFDHIIGKYRKQLLENDFESFLENEISRIQKTS